MNRLPLARVPEVSLDEVADAFGLSVRTLTRRFRAETGLTLGSWQDIWLHEGFACYAEWLWSEESGHRSVQQWADHFGAEFLSGALGKRE